MEVPLLSNENTVKGAIKKELFNVYGPVRLATDEIDDWYITAKNMSISVGSIVRVSYRDPEALISFHYVNPLEATLLYRLLTNKIQADTSGELFKIWPKSNVDAGPYSKKLSNNNEAKALKQFLESIRLK
jgi:hypothetical protein